MNSWVSLHSERSLYGDFCERYIFTIIWRHLDLLSLTKSISIDTECIYIKVRYIKNFLRARFLFNFFLLLIFTFLMTAFFLIKSVKLSKPERDRIETWDGCVSYFWSSFVWRLFFLLHLWFSLLLLVTWKQKGVPSILWWLLKPMKGCVYYWMRPSTSLYYCFFDELLAPMNLYLDCMRSCIFHECQTPAICSMMWECRVLCDDRWLIRWLHDWWWAAGWPCDITCELLMMTCRLVLVVCTKHVNCMCVLVHAVSCVNVILFLYYITLIFAQILSLSVYCVSIYFIYQPSIYVHVLCAVYICCIMSYINNMLYVCCNIILHRSSYMYIRPYIYMHIIIYITS